MSKSWSRYIWLALFCLPVAVPILIVLASLTSGESESWIHLRDNLLFEYISNTLSLAILVALQTLIIGVGCAWLTSAFSFPGVRMFSWALVLPLAVPAYIAGYVYAELLEFSGPIQTSLRQFFEINSPINLLDIRSLTGASFVISIVLFPYVYLFTKTSFDSQSGILRSAANSLGAGTSRTFFSLVLPLSRPAIAGGTALVLMETMADFGVVEHYGVTTFTTGIFRTWYGMGDQTVALQISACLFLFVALLVYSEQRMIKGKSFNPTSDYKESKPIELIGVKAWLASFICLVPLLLGFIVPLTILTGYALEESGTEVETLLNNYALNSIKVASIGACLCLVVSLWLAYSNRLQTKGIKRAFIKLSTMGYALPAIILAVGLLVPLTSLDHLLAEPLSLIFNTEPRLWLTGSIAALILVYFARFLTVSFNSVEGGLTQIDEKLDSAAASLGATPSRTIRSIHLPLLRGPIVAGFLLVFIDITKELPATLILRPFNFETLSTRIYRFASDERLAEAASECLIIIALGLILTGILASNAKKR